MLNQVQHDIFFGFRLFTNSSINDNRKFKEREIKKPKPIIVGKSGKKAGITVAWRQFFQ